MSVAVAHVRDAPPPPSTFDPTISPEVDAIVLTALAKDRAERYQSAAEMRTDIERVLAGLPVATASTSAATQFIPPTPPPVLDDARPMPEEPPRRSRAWLWVLLTLLALAVLGVVGWLLVRQPDTAQATVPTVVGQTSSAGQAAVKKARLTPVVTSAFNADVKPNEIISQDPAGQTQAAVGSEVQLVVSRGAQQVDVPPLPGKSLSDAEAALAAAGLTTGKVTPENSTQPADQVLSSDPVAGSPVDRGTAVALTVSNGKVEMPRVIGQPQADAEVQLSNIGVDLNVEVRTQESDATPGSVIGQAPQAGTLLSTGDTVIITVATAPSPPPSTPPPSTPPPSTPPPSTPPPSTPPPSTPPPSTPPPSTPPPSTPPPTSAGPSSAAAPTGLESTPSPKPSPTGTPTAPSATGAG